MWFYEGDRKSVKFVYKIQKVVYERRSLSNV